MAAPTLTAGSPATSLSSPLAVPVPSGVAAGSLVLLGVGAEWVETSVEATTSSVSASGFTDAGVSSALGDGACEAVSALYKYASGADSGSYSTSFATISGKGIDEAWGAAVIVSGGPTSGNPFVGSFQTASATPGNATVASFTPPQDDCLLVAFVWVDDTAEGTGPTGWTKLVGSGSGPSGGIWYLQQTTAAATGSLVWGSGGSDIAVLIGMIPPTTTSDAGTAAVVAATPALSATGTETNAGTAAASPGAPTLAASGTETNTGTAAAIIAAPSMTATGTETESGTAAVTAASPSVSATGTEGNVDAGTAAVAAPAPTASATGTEVDNGTAAVTAPAPAPTAAATGSELNAGTGSAEAPTPTAAATGTETDTGNASVTAGAPNVAASGSSGTVDAGTAAATAPLAAISATGAGVNAGTADVIAPAPTASADQPAATALLWARTPDWQQGTLWVKVNGTWQNTSLSQLFALASGTWQAVA